MNNLETLKIVILIFLIPFVMALDAVLFIISYIIVGGEALAKRFKK